MRKEEYPKELFHLMIQYAIKRAEITNTPLIETIKNYTPIYYLIGNNSWEFNKDSIYWKEFLERYSNGEDLEGIAYDMYIKYLPKESKHKWIGCFRYKFVENGNGEGIVKIHFLNDRTSKEGPLASTQISKRRNELKELFEDVKEKHPTAKYVQGGSWLYNLESYKRLFPKEYLKDIKVVSPKPQILTIWGQFINSEWGIKKEKAEEYLSKLQKAKTEKDLENIFEYTELSPKCEIAHFYHLFSIPS